MDRYEDRDIQTHLSIYPWVYVERGTERETQRQRDAERDRDSKTEQERLTGFKELAHVIMETGKSQICRASWRSREELMLKLESKGSLEAEFPLSREVSLFFFN